MCHGRHALGFYRQRRARRLLAPPWRRAVCKAVENPKADARQATTIRARAQLGGRPASIPGRVLGPRGAGGCFLRGGENWSCVWCGAVRWARRSRRTATANKSDVRRARREADARVSCVSLNPRGKEEEEEVPRGRQRESLGTRGATPGGEGRRPDAEKEEVPGDSLPGAAGAQPASRTHAEGTPPTHPTHARGTARPASGAEGRGGGSRAPGHTASIQPRTPLTHPATTPATHPANTPPTHPPHARDTPGTPATPRRHTRDTPGTHPPSRTPRTPRPTPVRDRAEVFRFSRAEGQECCGPALGPGCFGDRDVSPGVCTVSVRSFCAALRFSGRRGGLWACGMPAGGDVGAADGELWRWRRSGTGMAGALCSGKHTPHAHAARFSGRPIRTAATLY